MQPGTDAVYAIAVVPATYPRRCRPPCTRARPAHRVLRAGRHPTTRGAPRAGRHPTGTLCRPASQIVACLSSWRRRAKLGPSDRRAAGPSAPPGVIQGLQDTLEGCRLDGQTNSARGTSDRTHSQGPQDPTHGPHWRRRRRARSPRPPSPGRGPHRLPFFSPSDCKMYALRHIRDFTDLPHRDFTDLPHRGSTALPHIGT